MKQTHQNFTWLIYSSNYMPEKYKQRLLRLKNNNIEIKFVENLKEMMDDIDSHIKTKKAFSTIRLDDDDGIHPDFLKTVETHKANHGKIISFIKGKVIKRNGKEFIPNRRITYKKTAAGMTGINFNIYKAGNHVKVNDKHPIIYDTLEDAYTISCSDLGNTRRTC